MTETCNWCGATSETKMADYVFAFPLNCSVTMRACDTCQVRVDKILSDNGDRSETHAGKLSTA